MEKQKQIETLIEILQTKNMLNRRTWKIFAILA